MVSMLRWGMIRGHDPFRKPAVAADQIGRRQLADRALEGNRFKWSDCAPAFWWSMILSENRVPLFRIVL
jgi:hypothetical protein